jgi:hypothetical protein
VEVIRSSVRLGSHVTTEDRLTRSLLHLRAEV